MWVSALIHAVREVCIEVLRVDRRDLFGRGWRVT